MKKDILIIFAVVLMLAVFIGGSNFQSVDEYYLIHIDDIKEDSETVFVEISCADILNHLEDLDKNLNSPEYLPADGVILPPTEYVLRPGDTAFDLLLRCVRHNRIQMEYQGTDKTAFGSVYIQSINYLYEFSCGPQSGWIFTVNGEIPDKGCSALELSDGDTVRWIYSCSLDEAI